MKLWNQMIKFWHRTKDSVPSVPAFTQVPIHIAVIMDGNGRWAKKRGLPRTAGHQVGAKTFQSIATYCASIGVRYFTVYAFSTENWKRSKAEVDMLMSLFQKYLQDAIETMQDKNIALRVIGDLSELSQELQEKIAETHRVADSMGDTVPVATLCINYGGRAEIKQAVHSIFSDIENGTMKKEDISEDCIAKHLYTKNMPDPDLIIRPSGEKRISNFLLWQCAYSEFYFTDTLWPDFTSKDMDLAIAEYAKRQRRYGGIQS